MTKDEFKTTFEDFLKDPATNMDKALSIQNEILTMYDNQAAMATAVENAKKQYTDLEAENKKLKEANFQLFMSTGFAGNTIKSETKEQPTTDTTEETTETEEAKPMSAEEIVNSLLGKGDK